MKIRINCLIKKKNLKVTVSFISIIEWQKVKNYVRYWNSLKRKKITVIIRINWDWKLKSEIITLNVSENEMIKILKKKNNKFKC